MINSSLDNWRARWYDKFQYFLQKIYYWERSVYINLVFLFCEYKNWDSFFLNLYNLNATRIAKRKSKIKQKNITTWSATHWERLRTVSEQTWDVSHQQNRKKKSVASQKDCWDHPFSITNHSSLQQYSVSQCNTRIWCYGRNQFYI